MKKVLIVDDEEPILALLSVIVSSIPGCTIIRAVDGKGAIDLVQAERPDLMLLDNKLPGMSGLEVCRSIKSDPDLSSTKVLILSCQGQNFDWQTAREYGAESYLTKPFDTTALIEKIQALLK